MNGFPNLRRSTAEVVIRLKSWNNNEAHQEKITMFQKYMMLTKKMRLIKKSVVFI